jgi:small subunit ribosomal protein S20
MRGSFNARPAACPRRSPGAGPLEIRFVANIKSAEQRAKQAVKRRAHNMAARSRFRTAVKKALVAAESGNREEAVAAYRSAQPVIDTMVTKGIIHRNKAARHKREINARIKAIAAK